jgi:hypothetical protein
MARAVRVRPADRPPPVEERPEHPRRPSVGLGRTVREAPRRPAHETDGDPAGGSRNLGSSNPSQRLGACSGTRKQSARRRVSPSPTSFVDQAFTVLPRRGRRRRGGLRRRVLGEYGDEATDHHEDEHEQRVPRSPVATPGAVKQSEADRAADRGYDGAAPASGGEPSKTSRPWKRTSRPSSPYSVMGSPGRFLKSAARISSWIAANAGSPAR